MNQRCPYQTAVVGRVTHTGSVARLGIDGGVTTIRDSNIPNSIGW
jgi:hypothetical protein